MTYEIDGPAVISFSGGRTSGLLLRRVLDAGVASDVHVLFANTGKERAETLDFVRDCQEQWGATVTWLEYKPYTRETPLSERYTEVTWKTASRNGEPFDALISHRRRLPNPLQRFCTQELKIRPMREWMKAHGYRRWDMVIGLRADEPRRVARMKAAADKGKERWRPVLPLAHNGVVEADVMAFWGKQPFDLRLQQWEGNCDLCFLKSRDKKLRIIQDSPQLADWWAAKEAANGQPFRRHGDDYQTLMRKARLPLASEMCDLDDLGDCVCTD